MNIYHESKCDLATKYEKLVNCSSSSHFITWALKQFLGNS